MAMTPYRLAALVAGVSSAVIAVGIGLIYAPAGVIAGGLEGIGAAYLIAYLHAKGVRW